MKKHWLLAVFSILILSFVFGPSLPGQQNSTPETYNGEPVYKVGHGITAPRITVDPEPEYDEQDRKDKVQGTVVLWLIVTKEGRTADIKVTRHLALGLDDQAIKAVSKWRFDPATKDGKPVAVRINAEITFRL